VKQAFCCAASGQSTGASLSCCRLTESLGLQPVIEFIDPVIAAGALLFHAEAVAAGAENVDFRLLPADFKAS